MIDRYDEVSAGFFDELARSSCDDLRNRFTAMLRELVLKCAIEGGENPSVGLDRWVGGRISICSELMNGAEAALARERGTANLQPEAGFSDAPI